MKMEKPISEISSEYMQQVLNKLEQEGIDYLDQFAECETQLDVMRLCKDEALEKLVPEEQKAEMRRIKLLYEAEASGVQIAMSELRGKIDTITLAVQHTIRGEKRQSVWNKGRTTWDMPRLNAYATKHPEVAELKKTGKPSVTVRKISSG